MEKYEHKSYTIEDFCVRDKIKYFYGIHQTLVVYGKSMHKIIIRNIFPVGLEEFNSFCRNLSRRGGCNMKIIKGLFNRKTCYFCKKNKNRMINYLDDNGRRIKVCPLCLEYAERRALRRK